MIEIIYENKIICIVGELSVTNVFHYTFKIKDKDAPIIVPKTYHESMLYLTGRRHFKASTGL